MKFYSILSFVIALLLLTSCSQEVPKVEELPEETKQPLSSKELEDLLRHSVVLVETEDGQGTGFLVGDYGCVITNAHVVESVGVGKDVVLYARTKDGQQETLSGYICATKQTDNADFAIIAIPNFSNLYSGKFEGLTFSKDAPQMHAKCMIGGFPRGSDVSKNITILTEVIDAIEDEGRFRITALTEKGNSGSPVIDEYGHCIGIIYAKHRDTSINYIMSAKDIDHTVDDLVNVYLTNENISVEDKLKFETFWNIGNILQQKDDYTTSRVYLEQALKIDSAPIVLLLLSNIYFYEEALDKGVDYLKKSYDHLKTNSIKEGKFLKWDTVLQNFVLIDKYFEGASDLDTLLVRINTAEEKVTEKSEKAIYKLLSYYVTDKLLDEATGFDEEELKEKKKSFIEKAASFKESDPLINAICVRTLIFYDDLEKAENVANRYITHTGSKDYDFFYIVFREYWLNGSYFQTRSEESSEEKAITNYKYCSNWFQKRKYMFLDNKSNVSDEEIAFIYSSLAFTQLLDENFNEALALADSAFSYAPTDFKLYWLKGYISYNYLSHINNNADQYEEIFGLSRLSKLKLELKHSFDSNYMIAIGMSTEFPSVGQGNDPISGMAFGLLGLADLLGMNYKDLFESYRIPIMTQYAYFLKEGDLGNEGRYNSLLRYAYNDTDDEENKKFLSCMFEYVVNEDISSAKSIFSSQTIRGIEASDKRENLYSTMSPWWKGFKRELGIMLYGQPD